MFSSLALLTESAHCQGSSRFLICDSGSKCCQCVGFVFCNLFFVKRAVAQGFFGISNKLKKLKVTDPQDELTPGTFSEYFVMTSACFSKFSALFFDC